MLLRLRSGLMLDNRRVMAFMVYNALFHIGLFGIADVVLNFYFVSLGYDVGTIAMLQSLPRLGGFLMSIPMGLVTARFGTYRVMLFSTLGCAFSFALLVFFPSLWIIAVSRFVNGFAHGAQQIAITPLMGALVDKTQHTRFFAYHNVVSMGAMSFGSFIGGSVPALMVMLFAPVIPAVSAGDTQSSFAYGAALLVSGIVVAISALTFIPVGEVVAAEEVTIVADIPEKPKHSPIPWRLLMLMALPMLPFGFTGGLTFPFYNLFFRTQFGISDQLIGTILSVGWMGMAVVPLANGFWEKHLGRVRAISFLMSVGAVGFLALAAAPSLMGSAFAFVIAISFRNTMQPLFQPLLMSYLPVSLHSVVSSVSIIFWNIGWLTATSISGYLQTTFGYKTIMEVVAVGVLFIAISVIIIFQRKSMAMLQPG